MVLIKFSLRFFALTFGFTDFINNNYYPCINEDFVYNSDKQHLITTEIFKETGSCKPRSTREVANLIKIIRLIRIQ